VCHVLPQYIVHFCCRLTHYRSNDDAGAVLIEKPISRSMHFHPLSGVPSGGPRPINTLNNSLSVRVHTAQSARSKLRGGETNQLQFETSRGSNVEPMPHATRYEEGEAFAESSAKRRKTSHQGSSPDSSRSADERLDQLDPDTVTFGLGHVNQGTSRAVSTRSFNSQTSVVQTQKEESLGSLTAYRNVENMMSSKPKTKKQQRHLSGSKSQQRIHGLPSSSPMSSISNPIDISGVDDQESPVTKLIVAPRSMIQGMTREPRSTAEAAKPNSAKTLQGRSTGERSAFFDSIQKPKANGTRSQHQRQTNIRKDIDKHSDKLNDQFIPVSGDRRTSGVSTSSDIDELQSVGTTVGNNQDTNPSCPIKRSHNNSPSKGFALVPHTTSPDEEELGMGRSNIRPEKFVAAKAKVQSDTRTMGKVREKSPSWSVDLATVSTSGHVYTNEGMALVLDKKSGDYVIAANGRFTPMKIQPQKVQRISWEISGRKVRFMSSQSGIDDNIVDLEFRTEKDVVVLLNNACFQAVKKEGRSGYVQTNSRAPCCQTDHGDSDYMDKIFDKRSSEYRKTENSTQAASIDTHNEHYVGINGLRQEYDDRFRLRKAGSTTNQRPKSKLVEDLWKRSLLPDEAPNEQQNLESMRNGIPRGESIRQALANLKPAHNGHLTRSTRASAHFEKPFNDPFDELEDLPKVERYSKTHGLGDPWKKPLTYPKIGKKKTTVEFSDLERLDEGEYLNDSLISFYLRFLEHTMEEERPDLAKRVYFFNTFFFATLMNTHKGRKGFNYEGVQKWTRNVDLFTYDYIVVPINDSLHWYLAIICNLPALDRSLDLSDEAPSSPMGSTANLAARIEENGPPSSSPTINMLEDDSVTLVEEPKEPDERGARDSFAEMSLDVNAAQSIAKDPIEDKKAEDVNLAEDDQEMLDGQLQKTMPGSPDIHLAEEKAKKPEEDPIDDPDQPSKAVAGSKRGKRKSMPRVTKLDPSKPAIITFDSLGLARSSTIRILKDYLREEAKAKRGGMEFEAGQIKGITASMIPLQENWYDCGLFLLGYVGKLLEDEPRNFITKVIRREYDQKDWPNLKPSFARKSIREQLLKLHNEQEIERQKERDAQKAGKIDVKQGAKVVSAPPRAISPAIPIQQKILDDRKGIDEAADDSREPSFPVRPAMTEDALKTALDLSPYKPEGDVKSFMHSYEDDKINEALMPESGQEFEERQPKWHSPSINTAGQNKTQNRMPESFEDEPSLVIIESQSQPEEAPRSFHHSHPSQAEHVPAEEPPELPAEIQDSQPSETARLIADLVRRPSHAEEMPPAKKRDVQEVQAVLVESPREPKRRKTGHEGVAAPTRRAEQRVQVSKAREDHDPGLPPWAKQGSSRRKFVRKAGKADEVINIDD